MLYHGAWLATEGRDCSVESSMAKLFVGDTAVEIVLTCQRSWGPTAVRVTTTWSATCATSSACRSSAFLEHTEEQHLESTGPADEVACSHGPRQHR